MSNFEKSSGMQGVTPAQVSIGSNGFTFVDLFAGCGGMSLGFELAGNEGVAAVEFDENACRTYRKNFEHPVVEGDIRLDETKEHLYNIVGEREIDVICGGFPCQGFSTSGKRNPDDPRNFLVWEFVEVVRVLRPKIIVAENVDGIKSMKKGDVVKQIVKAFGDLGYAMEVKVLKAADYGVPQLRERVIFIGNRIDAYNWFPEPMLTKQHYMSVGEAIGDLVGVAENKAFAHVYTKHRSDIKTLYEHLKEGEGRYAKRKDSCRKLYWGKPSPTVKDNHGNCFVHPIENRSLTAREMARLQSFPDWFDFSEVAKKYQLRQIGNAVPPLMAKAIAKEVGRMLTTFGTPGRHTA